MDERFPTRQPLLSCGVLAALLYVATDILAAVRYPAEHNFSAQTLSALASYGAPTERLVIPLVILYVLLVILFAMGVWISERRVRGRVTAVLLAAYAIASVPNLFSREVPTMLIFVVIAHGAWMRGTWFRTYSISTLAFMVLVGMLPAAFAGALDRIDLALFLVWMVVLATALSQARGTARSSLCAHSRLRPVDEPASRPAG